MALCPPGRVECASHARSSFLGSDNIPEDLRDPFYIDQYEQEHIKPPVIKLLLSGELYCRVCSLILKGDQAAALQGHQSVIQALSRKGIYVMESDDTPVTDPDLSHAPIKMVSACAPPALTPPPPRVSCACLGPVTSRLPLPWALAGVPSPSCRRLSLCRCAAWTRHAETSGVPRCTGACGSWPRSECVAGACPAWLSSLDLGRAGPLG